MKKNSKKGFTLAELLIVIAIIAILIAIMFPVFGAQIDKARAAADLANVRAKYSEMVAEKMLGADKDLTKLESEVTISLEELASAMQNDKSTVTYDPTAYTVTVDYNGYKGSFTTDSDVKFTQKAATGGDPATVIKTTAVTLRKDGTTT